MPATPQLAPITQSSTWDVFCRVIDNHGDVGVCWRLARSLRERGIAVRLWLDDARALQWMAGSPAPDWVHPFDHAGALSLSPEQVGDVVIEAFGCNPPERFVQAMAQKAAAPIWINLEYLSAESYVERSHALPSPQASGAGRGLTKWFFYPGFTSRTGGLLKRPHMQAWQAPRRVGERVVSVLAYANANFAGLLDSLNAAPTLMAAWPGPSQEALRSLRAAHPHRWPQVRHLELPWMLQTAFDGVLQGCDLNVVRGEDSLVSAARAGRPFIWQAYAQADGAHRAKLLALLDLIDGVGVSIDAMSNAAAAAASSTRRPPGDKEALARLRTSWLAFNCLEDSPETGPWDRSTLDGWSRALTPWFQNLELLPALDEALVAFAHARQASPAR